MNNLLICKSCGKETSKELKCCEHCGRKIPNIFMRHQLITGCLSSIILFIFIFTFIISVLGAMVVNTDIPKKINNYELETDTKEEINQINNEKVFSINDEITLDDYVITVKDVKKSKGSKYDDLKQGMEFVFVTVHMKNIGIENISYSDWDYKIQNSTGTITATKYTSAIKDTKLETGDLAPNGEVTGKIAFIQPKNDTKLELIFQPNMFNDERIIKVLLN